MIKKILPFALLLLIAVPLLSRDIDLDGIYINSESSLYRDITAAKERLYSSISSLYIDSNVIHAGWCGGDDVVYIREFSGVNIVYRYRKSTREKSEVARFDGSVIYAYFSRNGDKLYAKTLYYNDEAEAESEIVTVNLSSSDVTRKRSGFIFLDFTVHPSGSGLLRESADGSITGGVNGSERVYFGRETAGKVKSNGEPVLAYVSPDEKKSVLISGSGGSYRVRVITTSSVKELNGVTSNSDIKWIDNSRFIYRSGGGGDYSVRVYDTVSGRSMELMSGTMNPDINFSETAGIITCLDNQTITVITRDLKKRIDTGIEGEESFFSPDGRRFTSIYLGKLYVNSLNMVEKYRIEIRRNAGELLSLYRKAQETKSVWENDFSGEYIAKKIARYNRFLRMKDSGR